MLDPETELHSRDSSLTFEGNDVMIRPLSGSSTKGAPIVRTAPSEPSPELRRPKVQAPRRMSSYVLVISSPTVIRTTSKLQSSLTTKYQAEAVQKSSHSIVEELLEIIVAVYSDEIFFKKDFPGLGLFMKTPPGFQEHQAYFETFILRNLLSHLGNSIKLDQKLLWEPRVLTNLGRLVGHLGEAIFEGWFIDGAEILLDFLGTILEYLQLPDVQKIKSVRLCSQTIAGAMDVLHRVVLLRLSELDEVAQESATVAFLERLAYWQTVILQKDTPRPFLVLFCFLLYSKLVGCKNEARMAAANMWRMLLVQKAEEVSDILKQAINTDNDHLIKGFGKLVEVDNETFLGWAEDHREGLDVIFFGVLCKPWEDFVAVENKKTGEGAQSRISKRKEKLKVWASDTLTNENIVQRHEASSEHWRANIYSSENLKSYRAIQDQQNSYTFNHSTWLKMKRGLSRPCSLLDDHTPARWQLDQTEGRNRMRLRLLLDRNAHLHEYLSKKKASESPARRRSTLSRRRKTLTKEPAPPIPSLPNDPAKAGWQEDMSAAETKSIDKFDGKLDEEDDFEMVENPQDVEDYEDKNRKVLRSLHKDDPVEHIYNVSRIVGLEASEGLLVVGKNYLYLLDGLFQRSDSEIVNVWQAPQEERDPYLQMIAGREPGDNFDAARSSDQEIRSWRRDEVLSISKRRFLFRDVAMEVFFIDGRSYLLTTIRPRLRDELYQKLLGKISSSPDRGSSTADEELWRVDSIQNPEDQAQSIGARFTSVFAQNYPNPIAKRWMRGEISNFHYLMLINTMAGRTFNDLTQYPVFPWVLADYTSEELDLSNPRSFRDLSKPMGCQTPERQAEFRDRYQSFAEMGDHHAPSFHYGTHYSTAMIVTSYLIRLQPFVQSYLLLQGGMFDHPDRLFYSIGQAWSSASRDNMTDVRELIPEFFYLPEFLTNLNGYDFGTRQGNGGTIDSVLLPPWAKGDPRIFITKHREALESEYVSKNLHHWIDLIFGYKQQGEAALDATNVFHHLSYRGARDLDTIGDPVERLATIGIIHNFGQTPHQVFQRAHPPREDLKQKVKRLDSAAESLTRLPSQVFEISDNVTSLQYSAKHDRLLCSGPNKLHIGPAYDTYLAWGFIDGGIRFYSSDNHKLLSLFEHIHTAQLSTLIFADSKTLITASVDCTISIWTVVYNSSRRVELQPKGSLFGHRTAVTTLAVSRSLRALLSGSTDGKILLWDLNRLEIVRVLVEQGQEAACARIHDVNGTLMVCRGPILSLYTLNGDPILEQNVCIEDDVIVSCAFYEGSGSEYLERDLVFTGHRRGVVNVSASILKQICYKVNLLTLMAC